MPDFPLAVTCKAALSGHEVFQAQNGNTLLKALVSNSISRTATSTASSYPASTTSAPSISVRPLIPTKIADTLACSIVGSHLVYCSPVIVGSSSSGLKKLPTVAKPSGPSPPQPVTQHRLLPMTPPSLYSRSFTVFVFPPVALHHNSRLNFLLQQQHQQRDSQPPLYFKEQDHGHFRALFRATSRGHQRQCCRH
ncbi:unnamed protein product [Lampetra planeri]